MTAVLPTTTTTTSGASPAASTRRRTTERATLLALLAATAVLYLWGLGASGWANSFYAAAAQAGSESWKAFFYGSSDAANAITVDKTPLSLWPMALSIRVFGLSSWSLHPKYADTGTLDVALLHTTVKRATGSHATGLLAGALLALTPVAVLMFRFDNPDALLVLLMTGAVYATLRATESPRAVRWLVLGGGLVGLAYLTKMLQAFLVLPTLALTYLLFAATTVTFGKRILHLLAAFGAMVAAAGWWIAIVELVPASMRPYIGGSQGNSILELTLGYNGLGRLNGNETGSVGGGMGGGNGGGMWGSTGLFRLFDSENGAQGSWLLPAALLLATATVALAVPAVARGLRMAPLPRRTSAAATVWAGWLVVTWLTFSLMAGIFHAYYAVALAPAIAASVAIGAHVLWTRRDHLVASALLAATTALSSVWAFELLGRTDWQPWLRWVVLVGGVGSALALGTVRFAGRWAPAVAAVAIAAVLAGPTSYSLATAATPHTGSIPTAGPDGAGGMGGPGGMRGAMDGAIRAFPGQAGAPQGIAPQGLQLPGMGEVNPMGGGAGGLLNGSTPSAALTELLLQDADDYTWVAAAVGSNSASGYQLATEEPVMAIGGFNGSDPSPTLAEFKELVTEGKVHWFIGGGMGMGGMGPGGGQSGGSSASSQIATWVSSTFTATTVDGVTLYDLTQATS